MPHVEHPALTVPSPLRTETVFWPMTSTTSERSASQPFIQVRQLPNYSRCDRRCVGIGRVQRGYQSDLQFHFPFRFHYYAQFVPENADHHIIYKRPPVALVAAETKFPGAIGAPVPPSVQRALADVLGNDWVVDQVQQGITFNLGVPSPVLMGMGNPAGPPSGAIVRFANRDRTRAIGLTAGTVTVETTLYGNWPQFREVLQMALEATEKLLRPAGVTRTGLRYIDEIRVGDVDGAEWSNWLSPAMLSPAADTMTTSGWPAVTWNGLAQYKIGQDRQMVVRYGPQPAQPGFVVNPLGPLRRPGPTPTGDVLHA